MIKMAQLVKRSGVPKSTILFYMKEGLLPEPQKLKPNVFLYDDKTIGIVKYIKYAQHSLSYSINDIKEILKRGDYDFTDGSQMLVSFLEKLSGTKADTKRFSKKEFMQLTEIDEQMLKSMLKLGMLVPLSRESFCEKDIEMAKLFKKLFEYNIDTSVIKKWVQMAKEVSKLEIEVRNKTLENTDEKHKNEVRHMLLEIALTIKPYIFNRYTIKELEENLKKVRKKEDEKPAKEPKVTRKPRVAKKAQTK